MPVKVDSILTTTDVHGRLASFHKPEKAFPVVAQVVTLEGKNVLVSQEALQQIVSNTNIEFVCDTCKASVKWNQEEIGEDEHALPDAAYRILKVTDFLNKDHIFCGAKCAGEFLSTLKPLKSPREKAGVINIAEYKEVQKMDKEG